jgi:arylsulfatase A-like enzyme
MFMYLALPLMHMPVHPDEEVLVEYKDTLSSIGDKWRRKNAAMGIMLDNIFADVTDALTKANMMDNTIIVYASDNGAMALGSEMGAGSNAPLRGAKGSMFEGGLRVPAFVYSPLLGHSVDSASATTSASGTQLRGIVHVSDWLPTLLSAAGRSDLLSDVTLDGVDQWDWMTRASEGSIAPSETAPRTELLYNTDPTNGVAAVRVGEWKLIVNASSRVSWYLGGTWGESVCYDEPTGTEYLFNVDEDEEEAHDLAPKYPEIVSKLKQKLAEYIESAAPITYCNVEDLTAGELWREHAEVIPWMDLGGKDYECPEKTTTSSYCDIEKIV